MSAPAPEVTPGAEASGLEGLGDAFRELLAAERRLRGRDSGRPPGVLSMAHFRALGVLDEHGPLPAGRIAAAAHVTPASITQMLDVLEAQGLVVRERSASDRRVVTVSLTDEGKARYAAKRAEFRAAWERMFGGLSEAEQEAGIHVLRSLTAMLDDC
ncbi:MAG: transcriptional regulator, MarR family [Solirubrobacterales bacterium]|nr:transcriptional regulator, MarR family [Solirubrobacterales bacterium]